MKYQNVIKAVYGTPWMLERTFFDMILGILDFRAEGGMLEIEAIEERLDAAAQSNGPRQGARSAGLVGVIPIYGPITQRQNMMSRTSGGTSVAGIQQAFRQALADPDITAIVFDVDSPGGTVDGIDELAAEIRAARGQKPMVANANTMAASAALYLASAADEFVVTPSGRVGSIGVLMAHLDDSEARAQQGLKRTLVSSTPEKTDGFGGDPISEDGIAHIQAQVDDYYGMFVSAVSKGRGVSVDVVRSDFGKGRMLMPKQALKAGLVDRIETIDDTIARLSRSSAARSSMAATSSDDQSGAPAALPFAAHSERVLLDVTALARRAGEIKAIRNEEGRDLGEASRDALASVAAGLGKAKGSIDALLVEQPPIAEAPPPAAPHIPAAVVEARMRRNRLASTTQQEVSVQ